MLPRVWLARLLNVVGRIPFAGAMMRWYAHRYAEGSVVRIRSGYAQGMKWRRHHRYVNGYWLGQYELPIQAALVRELKTGSVFFDVGANAGFFTLLAATRVGPSGKCVAFDPDGDNIESIREQSILNELSSILAVKEAVSDSVGHAWLHRSHAGDATAHIDEFKVTNESIRVPTTTLDAAAKAYGAPSLIKMDVEGAEGRALRGAVSLLEHHRPKLLIEIHSRETADEIRALFCDHGYELTSLTREPLANRALPNHILALPIRASDE